MWGISFHDIYHLSVDGKRKFNIVQRYYNVLYKQVYKYQCIYLKVTEAHLVIQNRSNNLKPVCVCVEKRSSQFEYFPESSVWSEDVEGLMCQTRVNKNTQHASVLQSKPRWWKCISSVPEPQAWLDFDETLVCLDVLKRLDLCCSQPGAFFFFFFPDLKD